MLIQQAFDFGTDFCRKAQWGLFHSGKLFPIHPSTMRLT